MPEIQLPTKSTQDQIHTKVTSTETKVITIDTKVNNLDTKLNTVGKILKSKVYTANGTFVVPAGVREVYLTGGGGGGAGGSPTSSHQNSGSGGTTSFGSLKSMPGGRFGNNGGSEGTGGMPGGQGGTRGSNGTYLSFTDKGIIKSGDGGSSGYYNGGFGAYDKYGSTGSGAYCSGGGGCSHGDTAYAPGGGGGGDFVIDFPVAVTPGATITITIGLGGTCAYSTSANGGSGILTVKWWE